MIDIIKIQYQGGKPHSVMHDGEEYIFNHKDIKEVPGYVARYLLSKFPEDIDSANVKRCFFKKMK